MRIRVRGSARSQMDDKVEKKLGFERILIILVSEIANRRRTFINK